MKRRIRGSRDDDPQGESEGPCPESNPRAAPHYFTRSPVSGPSQRRWFRS
jgi:hypothetical protein